ncbi:hypothetical protein [Streptomyces sp. rh34]|uniref:hypothetical protein n=1 Tax=Streptomyces sp. rh34 TaxID=2034272 RepID=UPI000BF05D15|nr:hypothetical protein [Streptomyces sp. rh34]
MQRTLAGRQTDVLFDLSDYPQAPARPGEAAPLPEQQQQDDRKPRYEAASRIKRLAMSHHEQQAMGWTPEQVADHRTSMADARIALCIAIGNTVNDIDPASGYSTSRTSYDNARNSWIRLIKSHGFSAMYEQAPLTQARAFWAERRPQYLAGDDWLAAGLVAHRAYWLPLGRPCNRPTCDEHATTEGVR